MPEPQTLVVPGTGGSVLAYALPANVLQYVESVVAVIDNSGGAAAKPVLSIATGGGTPIADKTQGEAIPGGDTGRATWAHRLTDETPATPGGAGDVQLLWEYTVPAGGQNIVDTNVDGALAGLLPQTFNVLEVYGSARSDFAGINAGSGFRFNADGGAHYDFIFTQVQSNPPVTAPASSYNQTGFSVAIPAATAPAGRATSFALIIPNYASTLLHKTMTGQAYQPSGSAFTGGAHTLEQFGLNWHPVAVAGINRVRFNATAGSNYVEGSYFAVYGRK